MKILLSIGSWNPAHGGPFFSVGNLAKALVQNGHEVHLLAGAYPHLRPHPAPEGVHLHLIEGSLLPLVRQTYLPRAQKMLDRLINDVCPEVIHDNGLWLSLNHQVALAAKRHRIPMVLSPRGTLDPWAMQYRNWKKRIALRLYQQSDLNSVTCFHAASALEARNIRKFGLQQSIATISNGVDIPAEVASFTDQEERKALFMGRLHPVKNLPVLLQAWAKVRPAGWKLQLAGASEVGHRQELELLTERLQIGETVEFLGPIYGAAKESLLQQAQLSFLVSKSENFGIAAAEALAVGIPVITSKSVPWKLLTEKNAGWSVEGGVSGIASAISAATQMSPVELAAMGRRGREYATNAFSWPSIAMDFTRSYQYLTSSVKRPKFIV